MSSLFKPLFISALVVIINISSTNSISADSKAAANSSSAGYSVLRLFLEDEQHLTTIRHTKMLITFSAVSDRSGELIDDIATSSELALGELEKLAQAKPAVVFKEFSDDTIAKATFDSLRLTTAKEFLLENENFEKNLLLSQLKVLRVISHLARQLEESESNSSRKAWLSKLEDRYEDYYQQVNTRISISAKSEG